MIGQTISHYEIVEKLGGGGMGVVYKARDLKLHRFVALKFLPHELSTEEGVKARFTHEARAASALDHPNICTVYEIDEADDGQLFIAMAYYLGETLKKKIQRGPLPLKEALDFTIQIAQGLAKAHDKGIVHRDIKPANVMVAEDGVVKIVDFGLAQLGEATKLTKTGTTLGTPAYMSPEQVQRQRLDRRTDIWSLGVLLYEMVCGQVPFPGEMEAAVAYAILQEEPEPLTGKRTGLPIELDRIVSKALAKSADERYQHVTDLLVDLQSVRRGLESQAEKTPARLVHAKPVTPVVMGTAAAVLLLAIGVTWWLGRSREATSQPPQYRLRQLTRDTGLTYQPSISSDGRMIAYASDRVGEGNLDIWVQQVAGGDPMQLTDHEADETEPDFSPDGSQIAFQSNREGGGIYLAPTFGGASRLLALDGKAPKFSPDGQWVAYHVGDFLTTASLHVVPATGGSSRELGTNVPWAAWPVWSPDGRNLLFFGSTQEVLTTRDILDWWVVPREGGQAFKTGALDVLNETGLRVHEAEANANWLAQPDRIVFAARSGDTENIYQLPLSGDKWRITGPPAQLTYGISEGQPSVAPDGRIAFTSLRENGDVWAVAIDANRAELKGEPEPVVATAAEESFPTVSADGRVSAFVREQSGNEDVWILDNQTGEETPLVVSPAHEWRAIISPDGSKVVFQRGQYGASDLLLIPTTGGVEEKLADEVETIMPWSWDSRRIIYAPLDFDGWSTVDVETREVVRLLEGRINSYHTPALSPDGRWLTLKELEEPGRITPTYIAPVRDGIAAPRSEWVRITQDEVTRRSWWSPDGNLVYFFSNRDGFDCIWARRLDPATKQPEAEQFHVFGFHEGRRRLRPQAYGLSQDKLYLSVQETTGNIWLAEPQRSE